MARILVADPIAEAGIDALRPAGEVHVRTGLAPEELKQIIPDFDALIVRSQTQVTADILEAATNMKIIGRAGVGVDNIDVPVATKRGIIVVNSPSGNTIAACELAFALMMASARNIPQAHISTSAGEWKRSKFVGSELNRKTLGIVGLGKIGTELGRRARAFGMTVLAFDPYTPADVAQHYGIVLTELDELLKAADFVSIHTPLNDSTRNLIDSKKLSMMKPTAHLINCARGGVINEQDLADALNDGRIKSAAVDVYTSEPVKADNPLLKAKNCILTPHLGASTVEAQVNVAIDVAEQIAEVLQGGSARSAVNLPAVDSEALKKLAPVIYLAEQMGKLLTQLNTGAVTKVDVKFTADFTDKPTDLIVRSAISGLLRPQLSHPVNPVNAFLIAKNRGMNINTTIESQASENNYPSALTISAEIDGKVTTITGAMTEQGPRILDVNGFKVDIVPEGHMIFTMHTDKPGVIGRVGTLLGTRGVNISGMNLGRAVPRGTALMVLMIDSPLDDALLQEFRSLDGLELAQVASL